MPDWLMDREMAPEAVGMGWAAQGNELLEQRRAERDSDNAGGKLQPSTLANT